MRVHRKIKREPDCCGRCSMSATSRRTRRRLAIYVPLAGIGLAAFFSRFDFPHSLRNCCHSFGGTN
jgi:hypothetical protein